MTPINIWAEIRTGSCGANGDNVKYYLDTDSGELTIYGSGSMKGYYYSSPAPYDCYKVKRITIEHGVTTIGREAFKNCINLTNVTIPGTVTSIGEEAFAYCEKLSYIYIPESVLSIEDCAFSWCSSLKKLNISSGSDELELGLCDYYEDEDYGLFYGCNLEEVYLGRNIKRISTSYGGWKSPFYQQSKLTTVTISNNVTSLSWGSCPAFEGCNNLQTVTVGCRWNETPLYSFDSSVSVYVNSHDYEDDYVLCSNCGEYKVLTGKCGDDLTFSLDTESGEMIVSGNGNMYDYSWSGTPKPWSGYNSYIKKLEIQSGVTSIGGSAFSACTELENVVIPSSVVTIGDNAFRGCNLTEIQIPNSVTSIGCGAFAYCNQTTLEIPESVTSIGGEAFYNCWELTTITIPNSVVYIGDEAFGGCDNLQEVTVGCKWETTPLYVFGEEVIVKYAPHNIENRACAECGKSLIFTGLCGDNVSYTLDIESGILTIFGYGDMYDYLYDEEFDNYTPWYNYLSNIETVIIEDGVTSIGAYAFRDALITSVTIPNSVTSINKEAFYRCSSLNNVTIPYGVTSIGDFAFYYCTSLTNMGIPNSLTSIGREAFYRCSALDTITIPNSVTHVGEDAFEYTAYWNNSINGIVYLDSWVLGHKGSINGEIIIREGIQHISDYAFFLCEEVTHVKLPQSLLSIGNHAFKNCSSLINIVLPENLTSVGEFCFWGCSYLNSVSIPNSVTNIGTLAFDNCALEEVTVGCNWINNPLYAFYSSTTVNTTLHSYESGICTCCGNHKVISGKCGEYVYYNFDLFTGWVTITGEGAMYDFSTNEEVPDVATTFNYEDEVLTPFVIVESVSSVAPWMQYSDKVNNVVIEEGVTSIGVAAFKNCSQLTSVNIPESVAIIGNEAFYGCSSLTEVVSHIPEEQLPSVSDSTFYGVDNDCVLKVPLGAKSTYETTEGWNLLCQNVQLTEVTLSDAVSFENNENIVAECVSYSRILPNLKWNALYLPIEVPVDSLIDNYEVAYINDVHSYDTNSDGVIDNMEMELIKIPSGVLNANYPYMIKAKNEEAQNLNLRFTDTMLYEDVENTITCYSVFMRFDITGTYSSKNQNDFPNAYVITTNGEWSPMLEGTALSPYRLYLEMTQLGGSPVKVSPQAMQRIRMRVVGESGTTGIESTEVSSKTNSKIIHDLSGRRVINPSKGVYIMEGKKIILQ